MRKKVQTNKGRLLTVEKREQMFQVFFANGTLQDVVKECSVCRKTATKYKKTDKWDERANKIRAQAAAKTDTTDANRIAENIKLVRYTKSKLMAKIKNGLKTKTHVSDLDKIIRLEMELTGDVEVEEPIFIRLKNLPESLKNV